MVNGSRYYRALESVSIAHSFICQTVAVIYPCHIRFHQTLHDSQLQLLTARKNWSGGRPQRTVYPRRLPVNTVIHTTLAGIEPTNFRMLVRCATRATRPRRRRISQTYRVEFPSSRSRRLTIYASVNFFPRRRRRIWCSVFRRNHWILVFVHEFIQ